MSLGEVSEGSVGALLTGGHRSVHKIKVPLSTERPLGSSLGNETIQSLTNLLIMINNLLAEFS